MADRFDIQIKRITDYASAVEELAGNIATARAWVPSGHTAAIKELKKDSEDLRRVVGRLTSLIEKL